MDKSFRSDPLLSSEHRAALTEQWGAIAASFEKSPRRAVENADHLTAQAIARLAEAFVERRAELEQRWGHGVEATPDELRQTLEAYRSFFERLLAI